MSILEYIRNKVRVSISDDNILALLLDRGIANSATPAIELSTKTRELIYADALMLVLTSPTSSGGVTQEHGGFSLKTGNEVIQRVERFEKMAMDIYKKWGDDKYMECGLTWVDND